MRKGLILAVMALLAISCSGVTQEDLDAALNEVRSLESEVTDLEAKLDLEETKSASAEQRATEVEDALEQSEADLATARERFDVVTDLSEMPNFPAAVLAGVLGRGELRCGVHGSFIGFSETIGGTTEGFDADFCRAVAAAVLGDSDAVEFVPVTSRERWQAVRSGQVDVLFRTSSHTMTRDGVLAEQVDFGPTIFYDGHQLIGSSSRWESTSTGADLDGATVCLIASSQGADAVVRYAANHGSAIQIADVESIEDALGDPSCDLVSGEGTQLASIRETAVREGTIDRADLVIFPSRPITVEPLAAVYAEGDTVWADIVDWVVYAMILADAKGITSTNIDAVDWDAESRRLFGGEGDYPVSLGLEPDALYRVIKQVGSYGEVFARHLVPLGYAQEAGPNRPAVLGGWLFAPPAR
ncbi:MAG: transporter substrate-binding domain-containing protein [Acidimicrobiia bacterium]|nr:transporter substrate-binding domain-containing protein [Acidimicrobiia bacterium]